MTEIARCKRGAEASFRGDVSGENDGGYVTCDAACGWEGPYRAAQYAAIDAWASVMTPRPVVHTTGNGFGEFVFHLANVTAGVLVKQRERDDGWFAGHKLSGETLRGTREDCRAWLIAKLTAAGFDVETETP
jgi:hypothetical protein